MAAKLFRDFRELPLLPRKLLLDEKIFMLPLFVPSVEAFDSCIDLTETLVYLFTKGSNFLPHEEP